MCWIFAVVFFRNPTGFVLQKNFPALLTLLFAICLVAFVLFPVQGVLATTGDDVWLSVDTDHLSIAVMQGKKQLQLFENIAIGSNGTSVAKHRGDGTTPLGEFTITEIRPSERFRLFMALSYPNLEHAERAYQEHRINASEYKQLRNDLENGRAPAQNTSLGGQLGIHGLGKGDLKVHQSVNWTEGCIAVTNEQLTELAKYVAVGTRVVVR
jgi:murein L,D-transpeptidase YafK